VRSAQCLCFLCHHTQSDKVNRQKKGSSTDA
jgi:hypothetical protein